MGGSGGRGLADREITFQVAAWCSRAASDLLRIADISARDVAIFADAVRSDRFQLWAICQNGARIGSAVWSIENEPDGFAIVVNAAAVEDGHADAFGALWDAFTEMGRATGARSVICWTERAGLARKLERRGARFKYVAQVIL